MDTLNTISRAVNFVADHPKKTLCALVAASALSLGTGVAIESGYFGNEIRDNTNRVVDIITHEGLAITAGIGFVAFGCAGYKANQVLSPRYANSSDDISYTVCAAALGAVVTSIPIVVTGTSYLIGSGIAHL